MEQYIAVFFIQFILLTTIFFSTFTSKVQSVLQKPKNYHIALLFILFIQIATAALLNKQVGDVGLFSSAGYYLRQKIDFYWIDSDHGQYPFFPFLIFFHAFGDYLANTLSLFTFSFFLKLLLLLPSLYYISFVIEKANSKLSREKGKLAQVQFLTCPLTTLIVFFHGQIDVILIAFYMLAVNKLTSLSQIKSVNTIIKSGIFYALSIASKTWSILLAPLLLGHIQSWLKRILFISISVIVLVVDIYIYTHFVTWSSFEMVIPALTKAGGPVGIWGLSYVATHFYPSLLPLILNYKIVLIGFAVLIASVIVIGKRFSLFTQTLFVLLCLHIVVPNWGVQYLFWTLPFMYLTNQWFTKKIFAAYLSIASIYALLNYINIAYNNSVIPNQYIEFLGVMLWIYIISLTISILKFKDLAQL